MARQVAQILGAELNGEATSFLENGSQVASAMARQNDAVDPGGRRGETHRLDGQCDGCHGANAAHPGIRWLWFSGCRGRQTADASVQARPVPALRHARAGSAVGFSVGVVGGALSRLEIVAVVDYVLVRCFLFREGARIQWQQGLSSRFHLDSTSTSRPN